MFMKFALSTLFNLLIVLGGIPRHWSFICWVSLCSATVLTFVGEKYTLVITGPACTLGWSPRSSPLIRQYFNWAFSSLVHLCLFFTVQLRPVQVPNLQTQVNVVLA